MIVPNRHVASPEDLDDETQFEMALLVPIVLRAVRRALNPGGFNVGMNLGWVAGAGIAAHMHQHVVPVGAETRTSCRFSPTPRCFPS